MHTDCEIHLSLEQSVEFVCTVRVWTAMCVHAGVYQAETGLLTALCWIWVNEGQPVASGAGSTSVACRLHRLWPAPPTETKQRTQRVPWLLDLIQVFKKADLSKYKHTNITFN